MNQIVFDEKIFYLRMLNSTVKLGLPKTVNYIRSQWGWNCELELSMGEEKVLSHQERLLVTERVIDFSVNFFVKIIP
jgi:hypothetical protein